MKKILTSILAAGTFGAFGQGLINLDNYLSTGLVPVTLPGGATAVGANFMAAVYTSPGGALLGSGAFSSATTGAKAGRFNLGQVEVPGVAANQKAKLYVQVWDSSTGADYSKATLKGQSAVFETNPLGGNNPGDPIGVKLDGLQSFALASSGPVTPGPTTTPAIPEPSTIALGALGAAALVLRFRK